MKKEQLMKSLRSGKYEKEKEKKLRGGRGTVLVYDVSNKSWSLGLPSIEDLLELLNHESIKRGENQYSDSAYPFEESVMLLPQGASIGKHSHEANIIEIYMVLHGTATVNDKLVTDYAICWYDGEHDCKNLSPKELLIYAVKFQVDWEFKGFPRDCFYE